MTRRWEDNTETTTPANSRLDIIGFTLALDTQLVTLTRRNFLRALYAFFAVDLDKGTATVRELVRLAALASRYGQIYQVMQPYTALTRGVGGGATIRMEPATIRSVRLWKAM